MVHPGKIFPQVFSCLFKLSIRHSLDSPGKRVSVRGCLAKVDLCGEFMKGLP